MSQQKVGPYKLNITFVNEAQQIFFNFIKRNSCFSGGFGNGKTYAACLKAVFLLLTYPRYRIAICRKVHADLVKTTMTTFFKILPQHLITSHNVQAGITVLKNGSEVLWLHLDKMDEGTLRGLEVNSVIIDQAEQIEENIYLTLDARVGRWDMAEVPAYLKPDTYPKTITGKPRPPSYMIVLCNPEHIFHWIWMRFHPDSEDHRTKYAPTHDYIERGTDINLYPEEMQEQWKTRDPEWLRKFFAGKWGTSEAIIHNLLPESILNISRTWVRAFVKRSRLIRVLDHGDASPTCCLWFAVQGRIYLCYREYYVAGQLISYHRREIEAMSKEDYDEVGPNCYTINLADPDIFKKHSQKHGAFWTVAEEYVDSSLEAPPIIWQPADNNEFATRNRINELLPIHPKVIHPFTGAVGAPLSYFVERNDENPNGCYQVIRQIRQAKREVLGSYNGRDILGDDRDESIPDHAYDPYRYFVAYHSTDRAERRPEYPEGSLGDLKKRLKMMKRLGHNVTPRRRSLLN